MLSYINNVPQIIKCDIGNDTDVIEPNTDLKNILERKIKEVNKRKSENKQEKMS